MAASSLDAVPLEAIFNIKLLNSYFRLVLDEINENITLLHCSARFSFLFVSQLDLFTKKYKYQ